MSLIKLKNRIESYQQHADNKLLGKLPIIAIINGRSFSKITSLLDKPFCQKFSDCMLSTTLKMCGEIEGSSFAYQYNDEIIVLFRNDHTMETNPWYDNKIQKICSVISSIATLYFNSFASQLDINLSNDPIFITQLFTVPTLGEAINTFVYKQQENFYTSLQMACFYELLKKYDKNSIKEMLSGLSTDEKINLLSQECEVDFNNYPEVFRRGASCCKQPKLIDGAIKNKWSIDTELPIFTKDQSYLINIIK